MRDPGGLHRRREAAVLEEVVHVGMRADEAAGEEEDEQRRWADASKAHTAYVA
jgi:hypothetical protein